MFIGARVKDRITGFCGCVVGKAYYIDGRIQLLVQPKIGDNGEYPEAVWANKCNCEVLADGERLGF